MSPQMAHTTILHWHGEVPNVSLTFCFFINLQGKKLFQLKNPWSHLRWKGRYAETDTTNWTPDLQKELNFDPKDAQQFDNGKGPLCFTVNGDISVCINQKNYFYVDVSMETTVFLIFY